MKETTIQALDFSIFENDSRALSLADTLMITDNLDVTPNIEIETKVANLVKRFPMKLAATCMVIVFKGSVKFSVNFQDYVATENSCLIVTEGTIVENVIYEQDSRIIFLSFMQNGLSANATPSQHNLHRIYALQVVKMGLEPKHLDMIKDVYRMLRTILSDDLFAANREGTARSCLDLMGNIIMQASDNQSELATKTSRRDEIVARFLQCVAENYRTHRELSFYASQLCLSLKYISHVVHEQTGRHPSQWIRDYVILDAKTMLHSGRYTVQQVAAELNFPNQSFFGKYFKEAVGVSPKKWK